MMDSPLAPPSDPFWIDTPASLLGRAASWVVRPVIERVLGLSALRDSYLTLRGTSGTTFVARALEALEIDVDVSAGGLAHIPSGGPVIVAANHPRGALDGLVLAAAVGRVRPDVRLLANYLLHRIPELQSSCFFVDPFGGALAAARSRAGLRAAHLWLRQGGALIMFPAGEVSHRRDANGELVERQWPDIVGRLARQTGATVVPAHIPGTNSRLFYAAGRLHRHLRTALLPRELLAARRSRVHVRLLPAVDTRDHDRTITARAQHATSAPPRSPGSIAAELSRLPPDATLVDAGRYRVFCARAGQIPKTLHELGRLRALTYGAAGEGSGAEVDLDVFDRDYLHLFVWDQRASQIVGAYRLGQADVLAPRGVAALYTRSLFAYGPELLRRLGPALELGRSFVRPEYQRSHQALFLLWRGIAAFVVRHPQYRTLFGPVSISGLYCDASIELVTTFLEQHHFDSSLAPLVTPRHPRPSGAQGNVPAAVADVDRLLSQLESDGKRMPVLIRHYLKLNARALAFSVDPAFGGVVDALMAIDLTTSDPAILRRYFGDEGLAAYRQHHASSQPAQAA